MIRRRPRRASIVGWGVIAAVLLCLPAAAHASFGLRSFDLRFENADGSPALQAGSHPFAVTTELSFNTSPSPIFSFEVPDDSPKSLIITLPPGLTGNITAMPRCDSVSFVENKCPDSTAVGVNELTISSPTTIEDVPVYNLVPPPGVPAKIGFLPSSVPVTVEFGVNPNPPYNIIASLRNIAEVLPIYASKLTVWGNPADDAHDTERGNCAGPGGPACEVNLTNTPFVTAPRACAGPLPTSFESDSWQNPGAFVSGSSVTHDDSSPPNPQGFTGCGSLGFSPTISAQPTTKAANSPTGLDFSLDVSNEGLTNPSGISNSDIKKTVVTLPEGFTTNPSIAEGLNACTQAELARETASSPPGAGCPNASKIGTVEVETPLLDESVDGSLFVAKPFENEFGSLLALYMVIKNAKLGIVVKQALKVEPDSKTGRLTTVADNLPQLPFSHFRLHFREGTRSPLASPPGCGIYNARAVLTPYSGGAQIVSDSTFQIIVGPESGPCPGGGLPPFRPGLIAGTINNGAAQYSPFNIRMFRSDAEQEITQFSIKLPPGITGKLAGIPFCSDQAIAAAKARTGPLGGTEEEMNPSCPKASEIGRTLVGGGVGPSLAYAPGKLYLAGPYNGSTMSIAAITSAKVGPFDLGTVVVRQALKVNPDTAEVFVDATGSDPIPHIIQGVPVHLRDIRVYTDRPEFVLNPTNCKRTSTASTVLGSGLDFGSASDDRPVTVTTPFQAANCAALPFKPKLSIRLKGGIRRGATPALRAELTYPKPPYANIAGTQVTLPHSEFLEQAHIRTICTRVQFAQGNIPGEKCPAGAVYGKARAITPLLDEPLEGPVFLRSSNHNLPDMVIALHSGRINVNLVGRIDSVKGQIRTSFETVPDAPVAKFVLEMQGGKKGLLVNSTNICRRTNRATVNFLGQNGKRHETKPAVQAKCKKKKKGKKGKAKKSSSHRSRPAG